jgi:hypothetical protein
LLKSLKSKTELQTMKYDFSAEFLRVQPPDTTLGDAWESLCQLLLSKELPAVTFERLRAPDGGIDIYARKRKQAYQCKANERGALATADASAAEISLRAAISSRKAFPWKLYSVASNAEFSSVGIERIRTEASSHGLPPDSVEFLGPSFWHKLCLKFSDAVADRFYYRITLSELQILEALKQARYYDSFVSEARHKLQCSPVTLRVTCNRLHLEFRMPFSKELSVRHLLDVCKELYGINLDWVTFSDIDTSAGPSVSIADGEKLVPFECKIGELATGDERHFEFWIKIVWQDEVRKDSVSEDKVMSFMLLRRGEIEPAKRESLSYDGRRQLTISRFEDYLQNAMWERIGNLKRSAS